MKKNIIKGLVIAGLALTAVFTVSLTSVSAESVYDEYAITSDTAIVLDGEVQYTLEEMLTYAIQDEYLAQAEYQAIIAAYGEARPFTNIVEAEQTHIDLLIPLFEAYGFTVPENNASASVVLPESVTAAIATGVDAETANIAMYQAFLAQDNLPDDVRNTFELLVQASETHLQAFSKDRYAYFGSDMMNQIKNQWKKMLGDGSGDGNGTASGNQYKGTNGQGSGSSSSAFGGYDGTCPNA
ncbi:MAG: hypothetical protein JXB08_01760 [Bacilli bacterium]|nr:hypothetical protein [Bacilli bacterium]MBN2877701.1 hypothetical protein [Bacilli bacterium]